VQKMEGKGSHAEVCERVTDNGLCGQ
jgi:hypothetical protein